ncbi:hypothetical protein CHS0354_002530, partial [Potamilus streckersoni]
MDDNYQSPDLVFDGYLDESSARDEWMVATDLNSVELGWKGDEGDMLHMTTDLPPRPKELTQI